MDTNKKKKKQFSLHSVNIHCTTFLQTKLILQNEKDGPRLRLNIYILFFKTKHETTFRTLIMTLIYNTSDKQT